MVPQKGFATAPPNPKCVSANGEFHQRAVLRVVSNNLHRVQLSQTQWKPKGIIYSSLGILRLSITPGAGTCDMTRVWAKTCSGKKGPQIVPRSDRTWSQPQVSQWLQGLSLFLGSRCWHPSQEGQEQLWSGRRPTKRDRAICSRNSAEIRLVAEFSWKELTMFFIEKFVTEIWENPFLQPAKQVENSVRKMNMTAEWARES